MLFAGLLRRKGETAEFVIEREEFVRAGVRPRAEDEKASRDALQKL
jgi:hypothetical protein